MLPAIGLKVLVCDDEPHLVRLLQVNIERLGHSVVTARSGEECFKQIGEQEPGLVLLDSALPDMSGFEVILRIRRMPDFVNLPVVMMTEPGTGNEVFENYTNGAAMFLSKQIEPPTLHRLLDINRLCALLSANKNNR